MIKYFFIVLAFVFIGCSNDDLIFDIGGRYVNENMRILFTDTLSLNSYTVKWDSLATSNHNTMLVGRFQDTVFGDINARSYVDVKYPVNLKSIPADAEFDSIQIILLYNGYSIGDTTQNQTIKVYRLDDKLKKREDGQLYNTSSFKSYLLPSGQKTFAPRPTGEDSVKITLTDALGLQLFNAIKDKSDIVSDQSSFQGFLKGFVIDYDDSNTAVLGFQSDIDIPLMRLYYHYFEFEEVHTNIDFVRYDGSAQFNQIVSTGESFELPENQKDRILATETGNSSFVQAGTGIFTRIEIPYFRNFLELNENIKILHANLILEPTRNSYNKNSLPRYISAYTTDNANRFVSPLRDVFQNVQVAELEIDDIFHEDTRYTFDVTDFINAKLNEKTDEPPALLITVRADDVFYTLDRLVLGSRWNSENEVLLEVYYMNYEL